MKKTILSVKNLEKSYEQPVVKKISFNVEQGQVFGILGPNGAGKTTTLEMIEGLRPIDGGEVTLAGIDVAKRPRRSKTSHRRAVAEHSVYGHAQLA